MKTFLQKTYRFIFLAAILLYAQTTWAIDWACTISLGSGGGGACAVGTGGTSQPGWLGVLNGSSNPYGLPQGSIMGILTNLLQWLLVVFAVLGIVGFLISGVMYLISAGDKGLAEKAKEAMKASIYGIIIGLCGVVVMQAAYRLLAGAPF